MVNTGHEVQVAFALNIAAGFATILGGMVIFSKHLVHLANPRSLVIALSVSAGVMIFIALVKIFNESVELITEGIKTDDMTEEMATGHGWLLATVCSGCGIAVIYGVDYIVHKLSPEYADHHHLGGRDSDNDCHHHQNEEAAAKRQSEYLEAPTPGGSNSITSNQFKMDEAARRSLQRMGLLSALAIAIHNIPEGIATYVGAVRDSSVGISLAIAIGLHNIPEGIAVASPIYFATGSRWRGIMWCFISAIAEPIGGFLAWLAIGDGMDSFTEGVVLGVVCGVMICISLKELLPTAYKFAKGQTHIVAFGMFFGMLIMVTSLILFGYAGVEG